MKKIPHALATLAALVLATTTQALPTIEKTLTLGNNTGGIAIDPGMAQVYVTNFNDGTANVVDVNRLTVQTTANVGSNPRRILSDAARHKAYIVLANSPGGALFVGDATGATASVSVPVGDNPRTLGSNLLMGRIYVSNQGSSNVSVVDTATNTVIATLPVGGSPGTAVSNNRLRKAYVPNSGDGTVSVIDEVALRVVKTIAVGKGPVYGAVDAQHGKVYVNNATDATISVIDSATDTVIKTLPSGTGSASNFGQVNAVYGRYYLPNFTSGTLTIVDTATDTVAKTVPVGTNPVEVIVDAPGGDVYVVNQGSNNVTVINAATEAVVGAFGVGGAPWRMLDGLGHLYILNTNGSSVDTLTIATENNSIAGTGIATEFYHEAFNHYFHSATDVEVRVIMDGAFHDDWHRTMQFFRVWTTPGLGRFPVSRFFSTQWAPKSSHFYTANQSERDKLVAGTIPGWQLEADGVYYIGLPDANGNCAAGTAPLYRLYNNGDGGAPNHRLTGSRATRDQMVASGGWTAEGSGTDTIYACVPDLVSG